MFRRIMDWDEILYCEVPIIGRDLSALVCLGRIKMLRGPLARLERVGDILKFWPEWAGVQLIDQQPEIVEFDPPKYPPPEAHLTASKPHRQKDGSIVIAGEGIELYKIHPPGKNITPSELFGVHANA